MNNVKKGRAEINENVYKSIVDIEIRKGIIMASKRRISIYLTVIMTLSIFMLTNNKIDVTADTIAKTTQGVVLKTSELKVDTVIVAPTESENVTITDSDGNEVTYSRNGGSDFGYSIIDYAYDFIGTPYVFGANGPNAFDCSGFTKYVFSHFGIDLSRTSQGQCGDGTRVDRSNLQTGDLVFFNTYTTNGHVGIYIGDGDFIHASSGGVKVSSLYVGYYSDRYAGATRVF